MHHRLSWIAAVLIVAAIPAFAQTTPTCGRTVVADIVAFDQPFFWNRLGAVQPQGMMYALRRDVVAIDPALGITKGNVRLRADKRPRPIVLRMNVGDCLEIDFQNLLADMPRDNQQPATREASVHIVGLQLAGNILWDGSHVGQNPNSLTLPGQSRSYLYYAEREGSHLMHSTGAVTGGEGDGGQINPGLFGAVTVQPKGAEWYRSQITAQDLIYATTSTNAAGFPVINYNAVYPAGHQYEGLPILKMLDDDNNIIHTDLTALITGPNAGRFPAGTYPPVKVEPDREQPFREFVTIYHDEIGAVQAFPQFENPQLAQTLHSARDAFAINYGTGGIGAEILANRFKIGPMKDCTECKYEEFFLSAWTVGDPAMVVDVPANSPCTKEQIQAGELGCFTQQIRKAQKAFYPDDPSNVYHSYLRDHVKFRVVHAGSKEHHIHHQHTHQWLHTPDEDDSSYLDSQAIGPGSAFTLEMAYHGSGNRNLAVGDSIFHCHFYPHFAQGMWAMWRVHDVLEKGTVLDADGRPSITARALPDGEINRGTPIPAIVPLPTKAMAPLPGATVTIVNGQVRINGTGNPGYPFFIPGIAGHRPPHPPLDTVDDGGLPRHVITGGTVSQTQNRLNFNKVLLTATAKELPETGTAVEIAAMEFHEKRTHSTFKPDGTPGSFITNGLPRKPGAPYADPCVTDEGAATGNPRTYKAASFQLDVTFNKAGWHFPQQRITSLWEDVKPTEDGLRPPEPLFFRANSRDCITYHLVNLIPGIYEQDDFQVKTPTDIIGQHIHLVKFDVTASDGAANGFNYEDGSFSPDDVIERINAINATGGILEINGTTKRTLTPEEHPFFTGVLGAQTTVSRWYADDVLNNAGVDRTLRTVFTHDHFGPSTHQQAGLYAGLVIEPEGSTWKHSETGITFGTRPTDGGPTSWRADIIPPNSAESYREFLLEFADFQLAYEKGSNQFVDPAKAINPPGRVEDEIKFLLKPPPQCESGDAPPCPEAISADDVGTMVVNYRNEPLALRVRDPQTNEQAAGQAGDLAFAFSSQVTRADADFNKKSEIYPDLTGGVQDKDPFTPLLRAYEHDRVQVRILVGAHEEGHNFAINGVKWLFEPSYADSGFRNSQMMGISEHYEFVIPPLPKNGQGPFSDYLYTTGRATDDLWNGLWGILRAYGQSQDDLKKLPNNQHGMAPVIANIGDFTGVCPKTAPVRTFNVTAVRADQALPGNTLTYNKREMHNGTIHDPTAILYVRDTDLDANFKLKEGVPIEPLVLRAAAGDCISVQLTNRLPNTENQADLDGWNTLPMIVRRFNNNQIKPSSNVGLHPQLVFFDVTRGDGQNVGFNPVQTATPGNKVTYQWYAGQLDINGVTQIATATPIEFGAINLAPADPIKQAHKGAIGALIIEPQGSTWTEDTTSRASATVTSGSTIFRDFVLQFQTDLNLRFGHPDGPIPNVAGIEDPEDSGHKAFNYRTEPMWKRFDYAPETPLEQTREENFAHAFHNEKIGNNPQTPIFTAQKGQQIRFRLLNPGGHARNNVFVLHGHTWRELPYINNSTKIGANPTSEWTGTFMGIGPSSHFDVVPENGAGGKFNVVGDFLFRTQVSTQVDGGLWGLLRVTP